MIVIRDMGDDDHVPRPEDTIAYGNYWLKRHGHEKDVECQQCQRRYKHSRRALNAGEARGLMALYRAGNFEKREYAKMVDFDRSREGQKLAWWGLAEKSGEPRDDGSPNRGKWRVTVRGEDFLMGRLRVPSHAWVIEPGTYLIDLDRDVYVDIHDVLKQNFDFKQFMDDSRKPPPYDE